MKFILCDEPSVRANLLPLTFTRPVAELRVGIDTLREKWEDFMGERAAGYQTETYLQEKYSCGSLGDEVVLINACFIPDDALAAAIKALGAGESLQAAESGEWIATRPGGAENAPTMTVYSGEVVRIARLWDIFGYNGKQIERDLARLSARTHDLARKSKPQGEGVTYIGSHAVYAEEGARVDHAVIDTTEGPVYLGEGSRIMPGAYIQGPFALCAHSLVKVGAKIYGGCTFGPHCKVAGEVENSVLIGYSNKAHDGFLGDAVLGEWCNLGAGTNCSNLKNDYSEVRVWNYAQERFEKTGLQFCGLFMGDHSKSAIGTQFNTGTVVGVAANVFGAGFPKNYIPSFTWGKETYRVERAVRTAKAVWARRNRNFDETEEKILCAVYALTCANRERAQQEDNR